MGGLGPAKRAAASTSTSMAPSSSSAASIHATVARIPAIPQLPAAAARPQRSFSLARVRGVGVTRNADRLRCRRRLLTARGDYESWHPDDDDDGDEQRDSSDQAAGFDAAVALFNGGDFHACHDVVEELWYTAEEPTRTLLHAILQCAVGFHHLFNQVCTPIRHPTRLHIRALIYKSINNGTAEPPWRHDGARRRPLQAPQAAPRRRRGPILSLRRGGRRRA
ncbi:hypothetical protein GUJ93_ZPchr0009g1321 [Zizania palustris]|uniref:DUF309 domain-containing protein n=1 Tax=Zizania palustris TaxID=103762 RepID=A0A8J5RSB3_ZIZPA|nr:hypothetical protein GUJ93_ZPchr0009g1321 [Zizania palustris]